MRLYLVLTIVLLPSTMMAQDIIVLNNGNIIKSNVLEVTQTEVKYKRHSNLNGPTYTINKSDVLSINYENGESENFSTPNSNIDAPIQLVVSSSENLREIKNFNSLLPNVDSSNKNRTSKEGTIFWGITQNSVVVSNEIRIKFEMQPANELKGKTLYDLGGYPVKIILENLTTHLLYVDLANSFVSKYVGSNNIAEPWYDGTFLSENAISSSGIGVNAGVVANVLGIRGSVGGLMSSLSGIYSRDKGTSVSKGIQRVISIPPLSSIAMPAHPKVKDNRIVDEYEILNFPEFYSSYFTPIRKDYLFVSDDETKVCYEYFIAISSSSDLEKLKIYNVNLFPRAIYGKVVDWKFYSSCTHIPFGVIKL